MTSIRQTVVRFTLIAGLISITAIMTTFWLNRFFGLKTELKVQAAKLAQSASQQAISLIPGLLLKEEYGSIEPQLENFQRIEELSKIQYLPLNSALIPVFKKCPLISGSHVCSSAMTGKTEVLTEIRLGDQLLGYLLKEKLVSSSSNEVFYSFSALFGSHLLLFSGLIFSILFFIRQRVWTPLKKIMSQIEANPDHLLDSQNTEVSEIATIVRQINKIIHKVQSHREVKLQNEIARKVAHDIRGPLSLIQALAFKLRGQTNLPEAQLLDNAASRIRLIADDLLAKSRDNLSNFNVLSSANDSRQRFAHPDHVENNTYPAPIECLSHIAMEYKNRIFAQDIETEFEIANECLGLYVATDEMSLLRAVGNLLENAVQATVPCQKNKISLKAQLLNIFTVKIDVTDTGKGIPADLIHKLGAPGVSFGKTNGNGIGLASVNDIVHKANGHIEISSTEGKGTCVTLLLPLSQEAEKLTDLQTVAEKSPTMALINGK